jgi:NAD-dependent dihydropyrimidine dehydrogenase PreA subunit
MNVINPISIQRDRIDWAPGIDYKTCLRDRACLDFCENDVFAWNEEAMRVEVVNPRNCVIGCTSCAQICPVDAIAFPDKEELKRTLRRLRAEAAVTPEGGAR